MSKDQKECMGCGQDMTAKWPGIVHLIDVCPDCCGKKSKKLTYKMSGKNPLPFTLRKPKGDAKK